MNLTLVGTSRCDVPARQAAGGIIAPLNAARNGAARRPCQVQGFNARNFSGKSLPSYNEGSLRAFDNRFLLGNFFWGTQPEGCGYSLRLTQAEV